ncbi:response regulator [Phenylobacterium sp.]|uniref:response regulator n=1 Tax=Phenylobacterium sp. TaxID=1871053 RepID=UPI001218967A|nr:response regulator [Phenylobacterium sp.]THD63877.1 MAG: response regulator [Phenylobacterium sp.]
MSNADSNLVLLVEDEVLVCDLLEEALRDRGFEVTVARDASAAIVLLDRFKSELGGLITDIDLGSPMDGWSVAKAARALQPGLPVFYMSGSGAPDWPANGVANSTMMAKPFPLERLVEVVTAQLRPGAAA